MNPFKKGDWVRHKHGKVFGHGNATYAVVSIRKVEGEICWLTETNNWIDHTYLELAPLDDSPYTNPLEHIAALERQVADLQTLSVALTEQLASEARYKTRVSEYGLGLLARNRYYVEKLRELVGNRHELFFMRLSKEERQRHYDLAKRDFDMSGRETFATYPEEEDKDGND